MIAYHMQHDIEWHYDCELTACSVILNGIMIAYHIQHDIEWQNACVLYMQHDIEWQNA